MRINDTLSISPTKIFKKGNIEIYRCGISLLMVENNQTIATVTHPNKIKSASVLNHIIDSYINENKIYDKTA
jgi:hypothetical protein